MAKSLLSASSCNDARAIRSEVLLLKALAKWRFRALSAVYPELAGLRRMLSSSYPSSTL